MRHKLLTALLLSCPLAVMALTSTRPAPYSGNVTMAVYPSEARPCVSPDGKHILYAHSHKGVIVADANGENARVIAPHGDFAAWSTDNVVVYVVHTTDGHQITGGTLMAYDIADGFTIATTDANMIVDDVRAVDNNGIVLFTTTDSKAYTITIK